LRQENSAVARETKAYEQIPIIAEFTDEAGSDRMREMIEYNDNQIKADEKQAVSDELKRIANDPELQHLIKKEKE
jgi:hypothetical protein